MPLPKDPFRLSPIAIGLLFELALIPVALVLGRLLGVDPLVSFRSTNWLKHTAIGLLATCPMGFVFIWIDRSRWAPANRLRRLVEQSVRTWLRGSSLAAVVLLSLAAGLGEELLFRGLIQQVPPRWMGTSSVSIGLGLVISGGLFGLAHAVSVLYGVLATSIGLYLGFLVLWTGNLWPAVVAHATYDAVALAYLLRRRPGKEKAT